MVHLPSDIPEDIVPRVSETCGTLVSVQSVTLSLVETLDQSIYGTEVFTAAAELLSQFTIARNA